MPVYTPNTTWQDGASGGTPITAVKLNHIEAGITAASVQATDLTTMINLTDGTTVTMDVSTGNIFTVTLGGNRTLAITNPSPADGQRILLRVVQDSTGSRTLTLPGSVNVNVAVTGAITLSTAANKADYLALIYRSLASKWDVLSFAPGY